MSNVAEAGSIETPHVSSGRTKSVRVFLRLLGPAYRGLFLKRGKTRPTASMPAHHDAHFDWSYTRDHHEFSRLYQAAKRSQWNADTDIDWSIDVDPFDPEKPLFAEEMLPLVEIPTYRKLERREQLVHRHALSAWMLSQFLHGEQGALFAACQVTEAVHWMDAKLYGSTQVVDEGRHVEVFHRYLTEKLQRLYPINDNLYTIIDALMTDADWDFKFLGMQIMIEGLALGAFGAMRQTTQEPLIREILKYVITDEARHVHYGVVALREHYASVAESQRREREDWAYEVAVLMRNRFLAHEFYDEYYHHVMSRKEWDRLIIESKYMTLFRARMFRRLIPNLKRIGLMSERIRPHYQALGLLRWEHEKAAPELSAADLLGEDGD